MPPTRRDALARLAALVALPLARGGHAPWGDACLAADAAPHPLDGSIADYQRGRRDGRWTAVEVTRQALARCAGDGQRWRAIDALDADGALATARDADARWRAGRPRGPLDGVPVLAKSIHDVRGLPTTASSAEWARLFPEPLARDAIEVARLRAAGAVVLGKGAADDFAYRGNGTSSHTGQVRNPYDATGTRTPGGSSAGAAVAVAGGLAFAALGTDDGGSNRIPAQFTGVVGVKPTFGLVPRTGTVPTWPWLDTHGPLARTVADAALVLACLAGADGSDPQATGDRWDPTGPVLRDDALAGVRLGVVALHAPRAAMTPDALAAWDRALADLARAGAHVDAFAPPVDRVTVRDHFAASAQARGDAAPDPRAPAVTAVALLDYFAGRTPDARAARAAMARGYAAYRAFYDVLPATWEACLPLLDRDPAADPAALAFARSRQAATRALADAMRRAGVAAMVYPTMPFAAPRAVDAWPDVRTPLGYGNWLGVPEVSVPAGTGTDGMPTLNLSFVGLPGDDARLLALAHAYEQTSRRFVTPRPR